MCMSDRACFSSIGQLTNATSELKETCSIANYHVKKKQNFVTSTKTSLNFLVTALFLVFSSLKNEFVDLHLHACDRSEYNAGRTPVISTIEK